MELFSGIFPPFNEDQWIYYFDQYKLIPEFKIQNYAMTMDEFKVIFWGSGHIEFRKNYWSSLYNTTNLLYF